MENEAEALYNEITTLGGYQVSGKLLSAVIRKAVTISYDGTGKLSINRLFELSNELDKL